MIKTLLSFYEDEFGVPSEKIKISHFNESSIISYLDWLESSRKNSISTRNVRLAAIHSFARYVSRRAPETMYEMQKIIAIPFKKCRKGTLNYIGVESMQKLLALPSISTRSGLRDVTLLSLLYDTACRVQELCDLIPSDIRLDNPSTIRITGKGKKVRIVMMMEPMKKLLLAYMESYHLQKPENSHRPLFSNRSGGKLTRKGVSYILDKYFKSAKQQYPELYPDQLTPHCFRHSRAMHMLQAGINLIYIRDLLGHVDIKTTEIYARIDGDMKRKALEQGYDVVPDQETPLWQDDKSLLEWLSSL
jgi:site-specific recombinase XerD